MSTTALAVSPKGAWGSLRRVISTTANTMADTVEVAGSGISGFAHHARAYEHTARIDAELTVFTHRDSAIHSAALGIAANKKAAHAASGGKSTFDEKKAYADSVAKLEAKISS